VLLEIIHCLFHGGLDFVEFGGVEKYNIKKKKGNGGFIYFTET